MNAQQMEERIKALEAKVTLLEDMEAIKKVEKAYGYYSSTYCMMKSRNCGQMMVIWNGQE